MKKITMAEVAREAGCSKATVSYCITHNKPISEDTRQRVRAVIEKLGYQPSGNRRALNKSNIAILLNDLFLSFLNPYLDEIGRKIFQAGYIPQLYPLLQDEKRVPEIIRTIGNTPNIAGILCMASFLDSVDIFKWSNGIPAIIFIRNGSMLSPIQFNYGNCMKLALEHLAALGHRQLVFITEKETTTRLSVQAYLKELKLHQQLAGRTLLLSQNLKSWNFDEFCRELDQIHAKGSTAVITLNAVYASLVYRWAALRNYAIPEKLSVICLENTSLADWFIPQLTKISVPVEEIATYTVETLLAKIANRTLPSRKFSPYFVPGKSTAEPASF